MPECFAQTPDGLVLVANGHNPVLRWDGLTSHMELAGVAPPEDAITVSGSGTGAIVGEYYAHLRYVDRRGLVSDLSPISTRYDAVGATGTITDANGDTPIVITTSAAHGLLTGATVKVEGVGGNESANGTWTITVLSSTTFSLDESSGTANYNGGGTWTSGISTINYSNVETPSDAKITRRQILRNTDGQADVFYVDIDTDDLSSTSFSSTRSDDELLEEEQVPIFDSDGNAFANRHGVPPARKSVYTHHGGRMWAAVDREYRTGIAQVASGSTSVIGVGTAWTSSMAGRFLWVDGATRSYEISSIDTGTQTLTLLETYTDTTDLFASYAIRPAPAEARLLYYSEAGLPESFPAINALELQEDNDSLTGLMPKGSFLYILEQRHIYRLTFGADPEDDSGIFMASTRGCVNQWCWLQVDGASYLLDEEGVHRLGGDDGSSPVSDQVADLFSTTTGDLDQRINWEAREQFHALHFLPEQTMRWFVCLDGHWLPHHALCFNYRDERWWLEQFTRPIGASCLGSFRRNLPQQFLGSLGEVLAYGQGGLDGPSIQKGQVRHTVQEAGVDWVTLGEGQIPAEGVSGNPVAIAGGLGKGQVRLVAKVTGQTLKVDQPWSIRPDATSVVQLGAINWKFRSGWFRLYPSEQSNVRRLECVFQPLENPATMDMRLRLDFSDQAYNWGTTRTSQDGGGVASQEGSPDLVADLTKYNGLVQARLDGARELFMDGKRFVQPELEGFAPGEQVRVYELNIDGAVGKGE